MGFSRQRYDSGLPFPPAGDLTDPWIKPMSLMSLALAGRFFSTGKPYMQWSTILSEAACQALLLAHLLYDVLSSVLISEIPWA